jgi:hypothetical protein
MSFRVAIGIFSAKGQQGCDEEVEGITVQGVDHIPAGLEAIDQSGPEER